MRVPAHIVTGLGACYEWDKICLPPESPCSQFEASPTTSTCPDTATWFWLAAAVVAGVVIVRAMGKNG